MRRRIAAVLCWGIRQGQGKCANDHSASQRARVVFTRRSDRGCTRDACLAACGHRLLWRVYYLFDIRRRRGPNGEWSKWHSGGSSTCNRHQHTLGWCGSRWNAPRRVTCGWKFCVQIAPSSTSTSEGAYFPEFIASSVTSRLSDFYRAVQQRASFRSVICSVHSSLVVCVVTWICWSCVP